MAKCVAFLPHVSSTGNLSGRSTMLSIFMLYFAIIPLETFDHISIVVMISGCATSSCGVLCRCSGCSTPGNGQGSRFRSGPPVQPDPAAAHVADAGGPGAPSAGEGDRPHPVQAGRSGQAVRPQDLGRHRAASHRRGLLRPCRRPRDHIQSGQGELDVMTGGRSTSGSAGPCNVFIV